MVSATCRIISRLDYIADLGVDAIWISPFFTSPQKDFGYDVADYCDINPEYGTLADFDALIAQTDARGLKLMIDIVPRIVLMNIRGFRPVASHATMKRRTGSTGSIHSRTGRHRQTGCLFWRPRLELGTAPPAILPS